MKSHLLQMQQNTTDVMLLVFLSPASSPALALAPLGTIVGLSSSATINLCVSSSEDDKASLFDIQMYDKLFYLGRKEIGGLQKKFCTQKKIIDTL
jgi:hypothetical protein